jgi:hypothetical protein
MKTIKMLGPHRAEISAAALVTAVSLFAESPYCTQQREAELASCIAAAELGADALDSSLAWDRAWLISGCENSYPDPDDPDYISCVQWAEDQYEWKMEEAHAMTEFQKELCRDEFGYDTCEVGSHCRYNDAGCVCADWC